MSRAVVLYASQMGHTEKVAERIVAGLNARGLPTEILSVGEVPEDFGGYTAAILVGSVHAGHHTDALANVVKRHLEALRGMYSALVSVSLEAAVFENADSEIERGAAEVELHKPISHFLQDTGWTPQLVETVAGALPYSHVGPFRRLLLKRIAANAGMTTDTSHDHVFTNWEALDRFIDVFEHKARVMDVAASQSLSA